MKRFIVYRGETYSVQVKMIRIELLKIDHQYQRGLKKHHVAKMTEEFNPLAVRPLTVSERPNGELFVIDGQQELATLKLLGHKKVEVRIISGLSSPVEALLFVILNNSATVSSQYKFRANLYGDSPIEKAIHKIVKAEGFSIRLPNQVGRPHSEEGNVIGVPKTLLDLWTLGGDDKGQLVEDTLRLLMRAWATQGILFPACKQKWFIEGIGMWLFSRRDYSRLEFGQLCDSCKNIDVEAFFDRFTKLYPNDHGRRKTDAVGPELNKKVAPTLRRAA